MPTQHRLVVAGSVSSTERTLTALLRHRAPLVGVLGLAPEASVNVSDYVDLAPVARHVGLPYLPFTKINAPDVLAQLRTWQPTLIFAVGLSQLLGDELLRLPQLGCVGFHPTRLPEGRGRAPLAWVTMGEFPGAASFFLMDAGADSGPILVQVPYSVGPHQHADDVRESILEAIDAGLDTWVPQLLAGEWRPLPQDESKVSFAGRRTPLDGLIDWSRPAENVDALIRAASRPHPGAFSYYKDWTVRIWHSRRYSGPRWVGVTGRILAVEPQRGWLVQCGDEPLWIADLELEGSDGSRASPEDVLRVGRKLGYAVEREIHDLRQEVAALRTQLAGLPVPSNVALDRPQT